MAEIVDVSDDNMDVPPSDEEKAEPTTEDVLASRLSDDNSTGKLRDWCLFKKIIVYI